MDRLTDEELAAIDAVAEGIKERSEYADMPSESLEGTIVAAEPASGPEVVGLPVPIALRLVAEVRASRELLAKLEWAGDDPASFEEIEHHAVCPECRASEHFDHKPGCALARLLGREEPEV